MVDRASIVADLLRQVRKLRADLTDADSARLRVLLDMLINELQDELRRLAAMDRVQPIAPDTAHLVRHAPNG